MKNTLTLFCLLLMLGAKSQVTTFGQPGAKWRYLFFNSTYSQQYTNEDMVYTGDSIVDDETVKVLHYGTFFKTPIEDYCHKVFIKQHGDTVFMKNCMTGGVWQILYNYAATAGQSWSTTVKDSSLYGGGSHRFTTYSIIVNAVTTDTINNMILKKLLVSCGYPSPFSNMIITYNAEILERIGCTTYLFNYNILPHGADAPELSDFVCYQDNAFGTASFSDKQCDYNVGLREISSNANLKYFPQPAGQALTIEAEQSSGNCEIQLLDATGKTVLQLHSSVQNSKLVIDLGSLPGGLYLLRLTDDHQHVTSGKVIKE